VSDGVGQPALLASLQPPPGSAQGWTPLSQSGQQHRPFTRLPRCPAEVHALLRKSRDRLVARTKGGASKL
jgi:hypothetical protein